MAIMSIYNTPVRSGVYGTVTVYNSSQITIVSGSTTQNYYGYNFVYGNNSVVGGTLTGTNYYDSLNGGLQYQISGLNHSAASVYSYVASNNQNGLIQYLLNGPDVINGSSGDDLLYGYDMSDTIYGGGGNDTLVGGTYGDSMVGGQGNDTYYLYDNNDVLVEYANEGNDTVISDLFGYTLGQNFENLRFSFYGTNGTGNELDNVITGNDRGNLLDGRAGSDTINGGAGIDTADYSSASAAINVDLRNNVANNDGFGNFDLLYSIENIYGSAYDDYVVGDGGDNRLEGRLGNDTLDGSSGNDALIGGAGNDTYGVDSLSDVVTELAGEGTDSVNVILASYTLGANVENMRYTGAGNFSGIGNELGNTIQGGVGNDALYGLAGNDTLIGGGGNDVLGGGAGNDDMS
ncbi:MAG: hypothetical protein H6R18_1156, partial [Proteobacteria bacterium]|nr:hypothetical protein [Pseudomonadota bacterium]